MPNKKNRQRTARLWEDTVVMAIRDYQWISFFQNNPEPIIQTDDGSKALANATGLIRGPRGMIKLDGRAEGRLGDVALAAGEKLFLIEVKPTAEQFRDEWQKKGRFAPKILYRSLATVTKFFNDFAKTDAWIKHLLATQRNRSKDTTTSADRMLRLSLRGHMMAYWEGSLSSKIGPGELVVLPYVSAMGLSIAPSDSKRLGMISTLPFEISIAAHGPLATTGPQPLDVLWDPNGHVDLHFQSEKTSPVDLNIGSLGLDPEEFQTYVNWLVRKARKAGDSSFEPINAVVLSSEGRFFQWMTTTKHLAELALLKFTVPANRPSAVPHRGLQLR